MAPPPRTEEVAFLDQLGAFHEERGTAFDRDPKVSGRPVKLLDLYRTVLREGGYDVLSAERMRWRQLAKEFGLGHHHEAAMTFQLKTVYYKYLAAYEIKYHWREEPPPPEIVENLTAKGGDVRKRTIENFNAPGSRESGFVADGIESAEDEQKTPKLGEMTEADDTGSGGRYSTRQLRQDPKRTQLFQPDLGPTRRMFARATSSPRASPVPPQQHQHNSSSDPRNASFTIDKYQARQPMAMALRPVVTPGNNPEIYRQRAAAARAKGFPKVALEPQQALKHVPGVIMRGPNIYIRCLYGLRSEIPEEQDFALHHLVKVSFERGDKYKFEGFPQLAESLLEKALKISTLIHGIKWTVSYDEDAGLKDGNVLNGSFGTDGLYERLQTLPVLADEDFLACPEFFNKLSKLNETTLVLRNMVMLEENALFMSKFSLLRDFLIIALNLPQQERLVEYCHYALEIAEQVTKFWDLDSTSAIYPSLLKNLTSSDRGIILSSARAIARIGMESARPTQPADIPIPTIRTLASYILLEFDDELMLASLDLLYQYTAVSENMTRVLTSEPAILRRITPRLVSLVLHNAQAHEHRIKIKDVQRLPAVNNIPVVPDDLYKDLLNFHEPDRSNKWLRCCFEEAPNEDITQIAIWQAYQGRFQSDGPIPAADFIKNVSVTFSTAQAQVINGPNPRFIIKGIRPRRAPVSVNGEPYHKCLWRTTVQEENVQSSPGTLEPLACGMWRPTPQALWSHMVTDHLAIPVKDDAQFDATAQGLYQCKWLGCAKHANAVETSALAAGLHVRLHVNQSSKTSTASTTALAKSNDIVKDAEYLRHPYYSTLVDEKGMPAGISYIAVLVLKNFARHAIRQHQSGQVGEVSVMDELFGEVKDQLWNNFTLHKTLRADLDHLIAMVYRANSERNDNAICRAINNGDVT